MSCLFLMFHSRPQLCRLVWVANCSTWLLSGATSSLYIFCSYLKSCTALQSYVCFFLQHRYDCQQYCFPVFLCPLCNIFYPLLFAFGNSNLNVYVVSSWWHFSLTSILAAFVGCQADFNGFARAHRQIHSFTLASFIHYLCGQWWLQLPSPVVPFACQWPHSNFDHCIHEKWPFSASVSFGRITRPRSQRHTEHMHWFALLITTAALLSHWQIAIYSFTSQSATEL